MVAALHLDYLVETDVVELTSLLLMAPVDQCNELIVAAPPAILLALYLSIVVFSLIRWFGLSLSLVFAKYCMDNLLAKGMACRKVEQLLHRSRFVVSEFVDECFVGYARDERSNHVRVHDIGKLVALLGEAVDVLA
jgi:hypothetical protein